MKAVAGQGKTIISLYRGVANIVETMNSSVAIGYGVDQVRQWLDRVSGMELLKKLPTGL